MLLVLFDVDGTLLLSDDPLVGQAAAEAAGEVWGIGMAPDALVNVLIGEAKHGVVVGQFPTIGAQEHYGLVFEKGNSLVASASSGCSACLSMCSRSC